MIHGREVRAGLVLVVLASWVAAACSKDRAEHGVVTEKGGRVGPAALAQVDVPAGAVGVDVKVAFAEKKAEGSPGDYARPIGKAVEITPASPLPGAKVRLPYDPATSGAPVGNAFIAVYNEKFKAWVPLHTTYENGELVAEAPHFSTFEAWIVDPVNGAVDGIRAGIAAALKGTREGVRQVLFGEQKKIDCAGKNADFVVRADIKEISGCLVGTQLRLQNSERLPFQMVRPASVEPVYPEDKPQFIDLIADNMAGSLGRSYLPARGRAALTVDGKNTVPLRLQVDLTAMAMSGVWTMIGFLPGKANLVEHTMNRDAVRFRMRELVAAGADLPTYIREVRKTIQHEREVAGLSEDAEAAAQLTLSAAECVESFTKEPEKRTAEDAARAAMVIAKKCLSTAVDTWDLVNPKDKLNELIDVIANFPDGVQFLRSLGDATWFGIRQPSAIVDVTLQRDPNKPENPDNASSNGLVGDNWAFLTNVDPAGRTITFNAIQFFLGAAALKACKEDGRKIPDSALCNDYYYRDNNDLLRIMEVEPGAPISYIDSQGINRDGTLADLAKASRYPTRLSIWRNRITAVRQHFVP